LEFKRWTLDRLTIRVAVGGDGKDVILRGYSLTKMVWTLVTLIQATQPRPPCYKLGIRMGRPTFPKQFLASGRVGFYLRVLQEGEVGAGDTIELLEAHPEAVSIRDILHLLYFDRDNAKRPFAHLNWKPSPLAGGRYSPNWQANRCRSTLTRKGC
jgi:MOSC domain-containing protein YiiM